MSQKNSPGTKREGLDPILEATIERAMAPYVGVLPAEGLRIMRERLEDALTTHPDAAPTPSCGRCSRSYPSPCGARSGCSTSRA
jgi:hypothetical protein